MSQNALAEMKNLMGQIQFSALILKIFNIAIYNNLTCVSSGGSLGRPPTLNVVQKKGEQVGEIKISIYRIYLYVAHFSGSLTLRCLKAY